MSAIFQGRWMVALAVLASALVLGLQAGPLVWLTLGYSPAREVRPTPPAPSARTTLEPGAGILAFAEQDPFGAQVLMDSEAGDMAETGLGLTLSGVVVATPQSQSRAFIEQNGSVQSYRPGDEIAPAVTLHAVEAKFVILNVDDALETLSLPEAEKLSAGRASSPSDGAAAIRARLSPNAQSTAGAGAAGRSNTETASPAGLSPQAVIDQYRRRIAENPQAVLDSLALEASEAGYRVGDDPPEAVRRAGLRPGDVVTTVNGRAVGNVESDRRLYDQIAAQGRARIEIKRGDRTVTLTFPLR